MVELEMIHIAKKIDNLPHITKLYTAPNVMQPTKPKKYRVNKIDFKN